MRDGALALALGAITTVPLGSQLVVRPSLPVLDQSPSTASARTLFPSDAMQVRCGTAYAELRTCESVQIGGYDVYVEAGLRFPGHGSECLSLVGADDPILVNAAHRSAILLSAIKPDIRLFPD